MLLLTPALGGGSLKCLGSKSLSRSLEMGIYCIDKEAN